MRDPGLPAGATANDVNDREQVTGGQPLPEAFHAYRLRHGRLVDLDPAGVAFSEGFAINRHGEVAGNSSPLPLAVTHAFLWSGGRRTDLGSLGGDFSSAAGINDRGWVVGGSDVAGGDFHAVLWR